MKYVISLCLIGVLFCIYMLVRNQLVYNERTNLSTKIGIMNCIDIDNNKNGYHWRYDALSLYSYNKMLFQLLKFKWSWSEITDNYNRELNEIKRIKI